MLFQKDSKKPAVVPASAAYRPRLSKNAVLTILDSNFCVMGQGRVDSFSTMEVRLSRLPGVLTMPVVHVDDKLYLQGENEYNMTFMLEITVSEASRMYITGVKLNPVEMAHQRQYTRYVINRQAEVLHGTGKQMLSQVCTLIDISMGGAKIESNFEYPMDKVIKLRVELYDKSGPITFDAQVIRVKPLDHARIEYGLLFAELTSSQRTYLTEDLHVVRENQQRAVKS